MFQTKFVEKIKTHFMFSNFFWKIAPFYEIMWKNIVEPGQATDNNMVHAHCRLNT